MSLSAPHLVMERLTQVENDIAIMQNQLEEAAFDWFRAKRQREHDHGVEFLRAVGTVAERKAVADVATALDGVEAEARWEWLNKEIRALEARATIGQSILRSQSR